MYHVQLYTRLHQARVYNLEEEELQREFLDRMRSERLFVYEGHEWEPRKTQLSVYEADRLRPDQIAMGRGWGNVMKLGRDVTKEMLAQRPAPAPAGGESRRGGAAQGTPDRPPLSRSGDSAGDHRDGSRSDARERVR